MNKPNPMKTSDEEQAVMRAIIVAQNVYADFPDKAKDLEHLHAVFARMTPVTEGDGLKIQSTVMPPERNSQSKTRV